jgi:S-adenosylmethionine:tRNA ribosyltransferase-isomerase
LVEPADGWLQGVGGIVIVNCDACGICMDKLSDYEYELPPELIPQHPLPERDLARLMVVRGDTAGVEHRCVRELPELLQPGDCLVFNDTRVVKARLFGRRESTGGKWEGLFLSIDAAGRWKLIGHTRGRLRPGERIVLRAGDASAGIEDTPLALTLLDCDADGIWTADPNFDVSAWDVLERFGSVPLPPYIERAGDDPDDRVRYQTVFARYPGAVAAPTAGLHFTPELLERLKARGIETAFVTLHVGIGTFRPIAVENLAEHRMHAEWCRVTAETAEQLNRIRSAGGRVVAVGTTTVRTLESACDESHPGDFGKSPGRGRWIQPTSRETKLFIRPPYRFRAVDALLTNFHLPKSSLLVMVSALLGREKTLAAYAEAVRERYRFYSYGDAMLIW